MPEVDIISGQLRTLSATSVVIFTYYLSAYGRCIIKILSVQTDSVQSVNYDVNYHCSA